MVMRMARELPLSLMLVLVVVMLVIPLPWQLLDVLISLNLVFALLVLLVTLGVGKPLEFSIFPSVLLMATLFRLAINVSSARLILLHGFAGQVISGFGQFTVGGNVLVGIIIFSILVIIQYIVITRGAERVAEVSARFTLDAMPGKQMAIDADLNAGLIDDKEARARRAEIEEEADFYGAMDGASKFVKGDAIAGIIILVVNIVGGLSMGLLVMSMGFSQALSHYTILTVGDGLVTQIPAILLSTATGLIVTKAGGQSTLTKSMAGQVFGQPRTLYTAAVVAFAFGLVPGLPLIPFTLVALVLAAVAYSGQRRRVPPPPEVAAPKVPGAEDLAASLAVDPLQVALGFGLLSMVDEEKGGDLLARIGKLRTQVAADLGLIVAPVRVVDDLALGPDEYTIRLRGAPVGRGQLRLGACLAMDASGQLSPPEGQRVDDPVFGLPATWVGTEARYSLEGQGFTVVDAPTVLLTHLSQVIRDHAPELLTRQETQRLMDLARREHPAVVEEVLAGLSLGEVQRTLRDLLEEGVPINDLPVILEHLADAARSGRDPEHLCAQVRIGLGRVIWQRVGAGKGPQPVLTLSPELEDELAALAADGAGAPSPELQERISAAVQEESQKLLDLGQASILLCGGAVRGLVQRMLRRPCPHVKVLAYQEVAPEVELEAVGVVR